MVPSKSYTFTHEGKPKVKERPRSGPNGGRLYTPPSTLAAQAELAASYDGPVFEGPIEVIMTFHPVATMVTIRERTEPKSPLRGDVDNYGKLVMDGLEGVAYPNDRQVMAIVAAKVA